MKVIINRKVYDTENAQKLATFKLITDEETQGYVQETLYITEKGNFFLHVQFDSLQTKLENASFAFVNVYETDTLEHITDMEEPEVLEWLETRKVDATEVIPHLKNIEPA